MGSAKGCHAAASGDMVSIGLWRDDLAGASAGFWRTDDPARFQQIDEAPGARVAYAQPSLQEGNGGPASIAHGLLGLRQQIIFRGIVLILVLGRLPFFLGGGGQGRGLPPVFDNAL